MADLIQSLYDVLGQPPPPGQELLTASNVTLIPRPQAIDGGAIAAGVAGGAIGAALYQSGKGGAASRDRQKAEALIKKAQKELGMSTNMVWAANQGFLLIFAAGMTGKPKSFVTRHDLKHLEIVEYGGGAGLAAGAGKKRLTVKLFELPIDVALPGDKIDHFVHTVHHLRQARG